MAQVTLPVEIWERIIDYVANDAATYYTTHSWRTLTLKSCALTCRAWTYRSIYHLNHIVTFRDSPSVSRFKARFPPRDLPCRQVVSKPRSMKKCSWVSSVPIQLNVALPLLTDLTLHHFDFNQAHTQLIPLLSLARSLESIFLADVRFASGNQFKRLIDSLRHVNQLVLRDLEFAESILTTRPTSSRKREVPIQSLRIFADPSEDNPPILFQLLSPLAHSITRIAIDDDKLTPRGILELQKFIAACTSLERFVLEIWNSSPDMPLSHIGKIFFLRCKSLHNRSTTTQTIDTIPILH
ncbi:hypothetical protein C8Q75DRAFT_781926 [Abortiporus biennis]|nr:hypothetical protein C8Q75DRAFT_781926 [Abortiporus biennis]